MSECSKQFLLIFSIVFSSLFVSSAFADGRADRRVKRFSVFNLESGNIVEAFKSLKKNQKVLRSDLPDQAGLRVSIDYQGIRRLVLRINGEKVRTLKGRKQFALYRRTSQALEVEWRVRSGSNVFSATAISVSKARGRRTRIRERQKRKVRVNEKKNPNPTPTPEPTVQPTAEPTPHPTASPDPTPTATATPEPTPTATPEATPTATPQPTATATPTATPTPQPTATPSGYVCGAGVNKVLALPDNSIGFSGYCNYPSISSISWSQISGPATVSFSSTASLTPMVTGFTQTGNYEFQIVVAHNEGVTTDTMTVGVSQQVSNYDFSLGVTGPNNVVRGFPLYLELEMQKISGGQDYIYAAVAGLPHGIDYVMADWEKYCCNGGSRGWEPADTLIEFTVDPTVTPGNYPVTIQMSSGGVVRSQVHVITVQAVPAELTSSPVASVPAIPRKAQWEHTMTHFGSLWCDESTISMWEGSVWYYDGMRIYFQIADYTGDSFWADTCVPIVRNLYRNFVLDSNGAVQGWRVFPHGLQMDFERNGESLSKTAAQSMAENSAYSDFGGEVSIDEIRETAYLIHVYSIAEELGAAEHEHLQRALAFALGHLDQVAISKTDPKVKPFMLALTFEALIRYYEKTGDPRIPTVIKESADFLWDESNTWDVATQSFLYINQNFAGEDTPEPVPDLNLLIAPAYGWLYHKTGDPKYQQIGDQIFAGGITQDFDNDSYYEGGACLGCSGKIFNQNYRWSIDYVNWRENPPQ